MAKKKKKKKKSLAKSKDKNLQKLHEKQLKKAEAKQQKKIAARIADGIRQKSLNKAKAYGTVTAASPGTFGAFGDSIVFRVNDPYNEKGNRSVAVPSKLERQSRGRWTTYNLLGKKPKRSFEGPDSKSIVLSITLDADQGVNPRKTFDNIIKAIEKGSVEFLVIGGKSLGQYCIESMGDTWERFFQGGGLTRATGELTFTEYA
jgi:phage protein U